MNRSLATMQYGGNQQRILNMMMHARQQQAAQQGPGRQSLYSSYPPPPNAAAAPQPLFVTSLAENDVLLGRGTPCAENEGNVRFRRLVRQRKVEYIAAEKRIRKDAIAREILDVIASRGGKFLRKVESQSEYERLGVPHVYHTKDVWAIVDEETQVQKVKQALRNKDDAAELLAAAKSKGEANAEGAPEGGRKSSKFGNDDVTNRFPRGVLDESNIHKADCNLQFGTGVLERAGSSSDSEEKLGSPKLKGGKADKVPNSPGKSKREAELVAANRRFSGASMASSFDRRFSGPGMATALDTLTSPASHRSLLAQGLDPMTRLPPAQPQAAGLSHMMRRQVWDKSQAAPSEGELRSLQDLQRLRMREQAMMNSAMGLPPSGLEAGPYSVQEQLVREAEIRQLQAQQAQMQHMAAARGQAARAASLQRSSFPPGMVPPGGARNQPMFPSASLAARRMQMEAQTRRASLSAMAAAADPSIASDDAAPPKACTGSDSSGERAIGIAQAMKRAEAFSPADSLETSHMETLILSVLCSHGFPVWTPEAHTKSFLALPTFAKRLDWTWFGFASILTQKAVRSLHDSKKANGESSLLDELAVQSSADYKRDPKELAIKTVMLMEKLRRHCGGTSASGTSSQRSLGMRVPLWLDRELSRWAMTLDIADPMGRPVPFSSADFVAEHAEYKDEASVVATAAFDPPLADDVIDQVALLTRLRSVFVKTKGHELHFKMEQAIQKVGEDWKDRPKGWDADQPGTRDILLCDRLLSVGFTGVLTSTSEVGSEYQLGNDAKSCPSFESLGLAKSSIQQRVNQITRELHVVDESQELQRLQLDRMERLARSVISTSQRATTGDLIKGTTGIVGTKRKESTSPSEHSPDPDGFKKQKTQEQFDS